MKILEQFHTYISYLSVKKLPLYILSFSTYITNFFSLLKGLAVDSWLLIINTYGVEATVMSVKFLMSIALLIFIRGGIPRYRFDHLTRIGWVKFLTLVVCFLLIELVFIYTIMS